jgi:hypothetical protein
MLVARAVCQREKLLAARVSIILCHRISWVIAAVWLSLGGSCFDLTAASRAVLGIGTPYTIDVWDTEDGLPQNSVIAMTQTRDGYLWLGTLNGLARFDGVRFTVFDESNTPGLNSSRIVSLFEDSRGYLWIGTETAGVALAKDGGVTSLDIGQGGRERRLRAVCEDSNGSVFGVLARIASACSGRSSRSGLGCSGRGQTGIGSPSEQLRLSIRVNFR